MAMKVVRQARLELSGGSTPDQLRPPGKPRRLTPWVWINEGGGGPPPPSGGGPLPLYSP